eukprot:4987942-Amphidinium_carterae.1
MKGALNSGAMRTMLCCVDVLSSLCSPNGKYAVEAVLPVEFCHEPECCRHSNVLSNRGLSNPGVQNW